MLDKTQKTRRKNKENLQVESEKKYYVEILKGIDSIQSTILSKLDKKITEKFGTNQYNTPKRKKQSSRPKSVNKTHRSQRSNTASKEYQSHCFTNRTVAYQNRLGQSHLEQNSQILKKTCKQPRTEERERKHCSKQAHYNSACTSRWQNQKVPCISAFQLEKENVSQPQKTNNIMESRIYTSRRREVNDRIKLRFKPQNIQPEEPQKLNNDIQKYYSKQIYKLQVDHFIDDLEKQFESCLHSKRIANPKQQTTLRNRMKNISLEINMLRDCRKRLQTVNPA